MHVGKGSDVKPLGALGVICFIRLTAVEQKYRNNHPQKSILWKRAAAFALLFALNQNVRWSTLAAGYAGSISLLCIVHGHLLILITFPLPERASHSPLSCVEASENQGGLECPKLLSPSLIYPWATPFTEIWVSVSGTKMHGFRKNVSTSVELFLGEQMRMLPCARRPIARRVETWAGLLLTDMLHSYDL